MGCQSSVVGPPVLKTALLKTNHDTLNAIIEEAERKLQELARICNPLEVAIDRFFAVCGRPVDTGFRSCFLALLLALIANTEEGGFELCPEAPGIRVKLKGLSEQAMIELESWRHLANDLDFTIKELTENLLELMDCAMTSHKLSQALINVVKVEELRVVDLRKVFVVLEQNEETIKSAAEILHSNIRRARKYSQEVDIVTQWLKKAEGWQAAGTVVAEIRRSGLGSAKAVLAVKSRDVETLAGSCPLE